MKTKDTASTGLELEGFQSERRVIEALELRINYECPRYAYKKTQAPNGWVLQFPPHGRSIRKECNLDPFAVRRAFEEVADVDGAVRFLRASGKFWPFGSITWGQFVEWQEYLSWLRIPPEIATLDPVGQRAWTTAIWRRNYFFTQSDKYFTVSRLPSDVDDDLLQEKIKSDRDWLVALRRFVVHPIGPNDDARISTSFYDSTLPQSPEDWRNRKSTKMNGDHWVPYLVVDTYTAIEAIAATIYADHVQGLRHSRCKHCTRIFKVESDHGQAFCPAPAHLNSSPCKNAYLQAKRRRNEKSAVAFLLECWTEGMKMTEIRLKAESVGILITPSAVEKANRRKLQTAKTKKGSHNGSI